MVLDGEDDGIPTGGEGAAMSQRAKMNVCCYSSASLKVLSMIGIHYTFRQIQPNFSSPSSSCQFCVLQNQDCVQSGSDRAIHYSS